VSTPALATRGRGRPPCCSAELALHIIELRRRGLSYRQIASVLNAEQIPTPMGNSSWLKSHVDRLLHTRWVQELARELSTGSPLADAAFCQRRAVR
jgi:hypothetical protein